MEAKYEERKQELLDECAVAPQIFERILSRLERFQLLRIWSEGSNASMQARLYKACS